jgi:hypothetical protein
MTHVLSSRRIHAALLVAGVSALLALPAVALAGSSFTIKIVANHHPIANCPKTHVTKGCTPWSLNVYVTKGSQKLSGRVTKYEFLAGNCTTGACYLLPTETQPAGNKANHFGDFTHGHFHDILEWPPRSENASVTLRVVVKTKYGTEYKDWAVTPVAPKH